MNTFEHFLIKHNIYNLEEREYNRIVREVNQETERMRKGPVLAEEYEDVDTWFDICFELGNDVWICPSCKTMHVFKRGGNELEAVYGLIDESVWDVEESDDEKKSRTGLGSRYDSLLLEADESRSREEYRKIGKELHELVRDGEERRVKAFCRLVIQHYSDRPDLIREMEKFLSKQELEDMHYMMGVIQKIEDFEKSEQKCPKCNGSRIEGVLRGVSVLDDDTVKSIENGMLVFGGGGESDDGPNWHCMDCGAEF